MSEPTTYTAPESLGKYGNIGLGVGVVGLVASAVLGLGNKDQLFRSYLTGFLWVMGFALGCLGLMLLHHLSRGAWGVMIRRILEAGARTLPLLLVAFVPVVLGLHSLYEWTHAEVVAKDTILQHKQPWLNETAFVARTAFYFVVWTALALLLSRWSRQQDTSPDNRALGLRMQRLAAGGLVLHILCVTFASFDWGMSLTPHWYSTIYGFYYLIGQAVSGMSLVCIMALLVGQAAGPGDASFGRAGSAGPVPGIPFQSRHLHDYGKLLFAFCCVWAYFAFSQFVIIWSGNLPEETTWYVPRMHGAWQAWSIAVVLGQYVFPFALLLSRERKKSARRLLPVAVWLVVVRWMDLHWQVAPAFSPGGFTLHALDLTVPLGLGGVWFWLFTMNLRKGSLLPMGEPFLKEALAHE